MRLFCFQNEVIRQLNESSCAQEIISIDIVGSKEALVREVQSGELDLLVVCRSLRCNVVKEIKRVLYSAARNFWKRKNNRIILETRRGPFKSDHQDFQLHILLFDPKELKSSEIATLLDWKNKAYNLLKNGNIYGDLREVLPMFSETEFRYSALKVVKTIHSETYLRQFSYMELKNSDNKLYYVRKRWNWMESEFTTRTFLKYALQVSVTMALLAANLNCQVSKSMIEDWMNIYFPQGVTLYDSIIDGKCVFDLHFEKTICMLFDKCISFIMA